MVGVITFLASYSAVGGAMNNLFDAWREMGFFSYLIPFLLIFALVFGILTKVDLFKNNKVINAIIALAVGLIAIQLPIVSQFFSVLFPNLGIALAIILVIMIVAGLFLQENVQWINYILLGIAGIIVIVVLVSSANALGLPAGQWIAENWSMVVAVVIIIGIIVAIVAVSGRGGNSSNKTPFNAPIWSRTSP